MVVLELILLAPAHNLSRAPVEKNKLIALHAHQIHSDLLNELRLCTVLLRRRTCRFTDLSRVTHNSASKKGQGRERNDDEEEDRDLERERLYVITVQID